MIPHDGLIFDLDGTLWDATHAVANARNLVMRELGHPGREVTPKEVGELAGLPVDEVYRKAYAGLDEALVEKIRERVGPEITKQLRIGGVTFYPGLKDGLERLSKHYDLYIVSNCRTTYLQTFLELSDTGRYFADVSCWETTKRPKGENIRNLTARRGLVSALYVGDTAGDETAAREAGVKFLHAAWGYGSVSEAAPRAESFQAMVDGILSRSSKVSST